MSKILKLGEKEPFEVKNANFNAIALDFHIKHGTNNTDITSAMMDASKIDLTAKLTKKEMGGKAITVVNGKVDVLAYNALLLSKGKNTGVLALADVTYANQAVAKDTSVKNERFFRILIPVGQINLDGADCFELEADFGSGFSVGSVLDTSGTTMEVSVVNSVGVGNGIVTVEEMSVQGAQSKWEKSFGNGVIGLTYINTDVTDQLTASQVVEDVTLESKELSDKWDEEQLYGATQAEFSDASIRQNLDAKYIIYSGKHPLTDCSIDMDLTSGNNNSGKNKVVVTKFISNRGMLVSAQSRKRKFDARNLGRIFKS